MEQEFFLSGYCRVLDGSRTVCLVTENDTLVEVDCSFESCPYAKDCPIGKEITEKTAISS